MSDFRISTFRWALVNNRRKPHLWLGQRTACSLVWTQDVHHLSTIDADEDTACRKCWAYAQGWLDRHDHGRRPQLGKPDPRGADTILDLADVFNPDEVTR